LFLSGISAAAGKVVFVRDHQIVAAEADGSNMRVLVDDSAPKYAPKWSPDGSRIVYRIDGRSTGDPTSHAILVVIDEQGRRIGSAPVFSSEADGTMVGGMRFVANSGWHNASNLFAAGPASSVLVEYRILQPTGTDLGHGYFGAEIEECPAKGQVAYRTDPRDQSRGAEIEINDSVVFSNKNRNADLTHLHWSSNCERLMFFESEEPDSNHALVVLRSKAVEAKLPVSADIVRSTVYELKDSFVFSSESSAVSYDPPTRSLRPVPKSSQTFQARAAERQAVIDRLHGKSPDWWPREE